MYFPRVIPCLLLNNGALVKTIKFKKENYIGDPINAVRIFNEKEVDELIVLDITASSEKRSPDFKKISELASECFMPFAYGGGIKNISDIKKLFSIGVEKVSLNAAAIENAYLITEASEMFGSQSIVVSIDVKKNFFGKYEVCGNRGTKSLKINPIDYAKKWEVLGAGELLITSIDRDGTWEGYDIELLQLITSAVSIPVIAAGGAGTTNHFSEAVKNGGVSSVAAGSMFVYQKKGMGVLINFPEKEFLENILSSR